MRPGGRKAQITETTVSTFTVSHEAEWEREPAEEGHALRCSYLTRAGAAIALICLMTVGCVQAFGLWLRTEAHRNRAVVALGGLGAVLLLCQLVVYFSRQRSAERVLAFYRNPHFWGFCLACTAITTYIALPFAYPLRDETPIVVRAKAPPPPAPPPPPKPEPVKEITFPTLEVAGLVVNGKRSTAAINGDPVMVGESIEGVRLVEITEGGIVVEKEGVLRRYALGKSPGQ
jgi:hypothetical protein